MHTHENDYLFCVFEGGTIDVFDASGEHAATLEPKAGDLLAFRCEGETLVPADGSTPVPACHSARNTGTTRYREVLVEFL